MTPRTPSPDAARSAERREPGSRGSRSPAAASPAAAGAGAAPLPRPGQARACAVWGMRWGLAGRRVATRGTCEPADGCGLWAGAATRGSGRRGVPADHTIYFWGETRCAGVPCAGVPCRAPRVNRVCGRMPGRRSTRVLSGAAPYRHPRALPHAAWLTSGAGRRARGGRRRQCSPRGDTVSILYPYTPCRSCTLQVLYPIPYIPIPQPYPTLYHCTPSPPRAAAPNDPAQ